MDIGWIDALALGYFIVLFIGYQWATELKAIHKRSIASAVQRHRENWMREMMTRDNRSSDAILLSTLSQGNAFFASTSAIAIGGLATVISGSAQKADAVLERLPIIAKVSPLLWEIKVLLLIGMFVYAFFKFAWAFRLTHYTAIMVGASPEPGTAEPARVERHALETARISGLAADHSNGGLRAFYHAAAVMAWFFNPLLFIIASTFVLAILIRRDFYSRSRRILYSTIV